MGFRMPSSLISIAKRTLRLESLTRNKNQTAGFHKLASPVNNNKHQAREGRVPRGHVAVYVEDDNHKTRHVIPIPYLTHPLFQDLLSRVEEEYGFSHSMGGLTIPCKEDEFLHLASQVYESS